MSVIIVYSEWIITAKSFNEVVKYFEFSNLLKTLQNKIRIVWCKFPVKNKKQI